MSRRARRPSDTRALGAGACVLALAFAASASDGSGGADLSAVARAGARPKECGGASRARPNRWDRAKAPGLEKYCDALARGYGRLASSPAEALALSAEAQALMPTSPSPLLLAARAKTALGAYDEAFALFGRSRAASREGVNAPGALHAYALAAAKTNHPHEALEAYRALAPQAELLDDAEEELRIFIEAAFVAMSQGADRLGEAVGYLNEARRIPVVPELDVYLLGALSLALDRQGRHSEASGIAAEASGPSQLEEERTAGKKLGRPRPMLPDGELDAMIAVLAERRDRELAAERWQTYLDSPAGRTGPFAAHARAQRDAGRRRAR